MWPWSIQPIVRLTTSGQRTATDEAWPQNQPVTFMKPTCALAAAAATAASVWSSTSVAFELHVRMFAPLASRQSTGFRCWCGESPTTIVLAEKLRASAIRQATPLTAAAGVWLPAQLPTASVACGCSAAARLTAQRYQIPQGQLLCVHELGTQPTLTNGTTDHWSRFAIFSSGGIHISACESPKTTSVLVASGAPSRQILLVVSPRRAEQPVGNAYKSLRSSVTAGVSGQGSAAPCFAALTAAATAGSGRQELRAAVVCRTSSTGRTAAEAFEIRVARAFSETRIGTATTRITAAEAGQSKAPVCGRHLICLIGFSKKA